MKILIIHNKYGKHSGEESVVYSQISTLNNNKVETITYYRESSEIDKSNLGKIKAFFTAFYSSKSIKEIKKILIKEKPDLVHIHNLYPLISPAILPVIKSYRIPVVMTVHNYRLMCPNGLFYSNNKICEKCSNGKEINCLINNCEESLFKSLGYYLRNFWARKRKYYLSNIDKYACLTNFQKNKLIENNFPEDKICVIPNFYPESEAAYSNQNKEGYVAFAGRISPEKGIHILLEAAKLLPDIKFKLAGNPVINYINKYTISKNVELVGMLNKDELESFYQRAKIYCHTSVCYEGFPMVFPEAMNYKLPIIAPNFGCYPEIINEGKDGLLFKHKDSKDLAEKIKYLYDTPEKAREFGENGYNKMNKLYSEEAYVKNLLNLYKEVKEQHS